MHGPRSGIIRGQRHLAIYPSPMAISQVVRGSEGDCLETSRGDEKTGSHATRDGSDRRREELMRRKKNASEDALTMSLARQSGMIIVFPMLWWASRVGQETREGLCGLTWRGRTLDLKQYCSQVQCFDQVLRCLYCSQSRSEYPMSNREFVAAWYQPF